MRKVKSADQGLFKSNKNLGMQKELDHMLRKFPAFRAKIIEMFNTNDDFRMLCNDYFLCERSLNGLDVDDEEKNQIVCEFRNMMHELEEEVRRLLGSKE